MQSPVKVSYDPAPGKRFLGLYGPPLSGGSGHVDRHLVTSVAWDRVPGAWNGTLTVKLPAWMQRRLPERTTLGPLVLRVLTP